MQFNDLAAQQHQLLPDGRTIREAVDSRIASVLNHGVYILGPEVKELETTLAAYVGSGHCLAVASGTDALLIALMALGVRAGDEVITTPFSFISTSETVALLGAKLVYVDINPATYNLDPGKLEPAISARTKAIIPVSLYGQPADFPAINEIAERYSLPVIEDGAQSFGSEQQGRRSCGLSTIGTTSFFPSKPFGSYGDGGACFTDDPELADRMRRVSRHGQARRYFHTDIGVNGRIDTLQAAILLGKWPNFSQEVEARGRIGEAYSRKLQAAGISSTPYLSEGNTSVYAQYTVQVDHRAEVQAVLKEQGIPTAVHYPTLLCQQPALRCENTRCRMGCYLSFAQQASERVMSLPMHPWLTDADQDQVVDALVSAVQHTTISSAA
ncbi:UDP-2-acetamido-2-dideoxy-d-ribo-hex-3-uluronic acid transaminase [Synechococcus sp. BOUM118]|nr:UDP-2-acetamido-2-dideoxy-d-ribo-hex-3-uluronic acid transaminase [Synechococcus sp. BOUM118]